MSVSFVIFAFSKWKKSIYFEWHRVQIFLIAAAMTRVRGNEKKMSFFVLSLSRMDISAAAVAVVVGAVDAVAATLKANN